MIYYTSDQHFGHKNIIKYCNRPFDSIEAMDAAMIERWNSVVTPQDGIVILGDFSFYSSDKTKKIIKQLNGHKMFLPGNHDAGRTYVKYFDCLLNVATCGMFKVGKHGVYINHFPYKGSYKDHRERDFSVSEPISQKNFLLHGHVHDSWKVKDNMINVGVDVWDFTPVSSEILEKLIDGINLGVVV